MTPEPFNLFLDNGFIRAKFTDEVPPAEVSFALTQAPRGKFQMPPGILKGFFHGRASPEVRQHPLLDLAALQVPANRKR